MNIKEIGTNGIMLKPGHSHILVIEEDIYPRTLDYVNSIENSIGEIQFQG